MAALDTVSIAILLGSLLILAGILSSLLAMRFGAPLLLVFLAVGMLAGEGGPGGLRFDDVGIAYTVGSIALALILFDGGLRTRFASIRSVLAPSMMLATVGVLVTALLTTPVAKFALGIGWIEALLLGAVVASTDAAAVFFLLSAGGLRLRPRVRATLEVESGTNDPFAIFLALLLVEVLSVGGQSWSQAIFSLFRDAALGMAIGYGGGRIIAWVLNRVTLAQGLHAPFVAVSALVVFGFGNAVHASGFLAVYLAGLVVGNRQIRAHNSVVVFLDAITWLMQIVMFVLLGLLVWPARLADNLVGAVVVALTLMLVARPVAVFLCLWPFKFQWREKLFISWVGLRGAVAIFLASIPLLVKLPGATMYFDVAFVVVLFSLLIQGWTVAMSARRLDMSFSRADPAPQRVELDLPGQLTRELVGYPVSPKSPFLKRGLIPNWARPTLVIRDEEILTPPEAAPVRQGDYVYLLAPPEKAQALDRFFMESPAPRVPAAEALGDFVVSGSATLGALADIYGLQVAADHAEISLADFFTEQLGRPARAGDIVALGTIALLAQKVEGGKVTNVGLRLDEPEAAATVSGGAKALYGKVRKKLFG
ncbi:potassium/proton antiporter [Undibacter mobilis]|uniref:Potassium/proton antiporter n=1 Tax=Undibacter mobilis TaxID=2292256 RepID=A0A371BA68_9BRAD|nr:potassium/proton antiporter [Undibacter mobilis]RDV04407.1 potassium/proton antiporter [Undibacter mobilis]